MCVCVFQKISFSKCITKNFIFYLKGTGFDSSACPKFSVSLNNFCLSLSSLNVKALVDNFAKTRYLLTLTKKYFIGNGRDPLPHHDKISRHFIGP